LRPFLNLSPVPTPSRRTNAPRGSSHLL
jgi:hypothetical protein